jgi:hypothetical protein
MNCEVIRAGGTGANLKDLVEVFNFFVPVFKVASVSQQETINLLNFMTVDFLQ